MRALLPLLLACACSRAFELMPTQFACTTDADCGDDTVCLEARCQAPWSCGDGVIQPGEACDDGRPSASTGCVDCQVTFGFTCTGTIGDAGACTKNRYVRLTGGAFHLCALDAEGSVTCTGRNVERQLEVPSELGPFKAIEGGNIYSCAIRRDDDRAVCWGSNWVEGEQIDMARVPEDLGPVQQLTAGSRHTCARTADGYARCWGWINGRRDSSATHEDEVAGDVPVLDLAAGSFHTCLLRADGELQCSGDDDKKEPVDLVGPFTHVENGFFHSCALRESGAIACFGRDAEGVDRTVPPREDGFVEIAGGQLHNCAVKQDHRVRCWGKPALIDDYGQSDPPPGRFIHLAAGARFTCGLREDQTLECWGEIDPDLLTE